MTCLFVIIHLPLFIITPLPVDTGLFLFKNISSGFEFGLIIALLFNLTWG